MAFERTQWVWMNGQMVRWDEARIHSSAHGLHYGTGVFEGTRCYRTEEGPAIFRLGDHLDRLFASAAVYGMEIPFDRAELAAATRAVVARNRFSDCYIRHLCYLDSASLGIRAVCPVGVVIIAWPWESHHSQEGRERGIRATVSPWRKFSSEIMPTTAKASGQYLNSRLAVTEAARRGYDEALLLDARGRLAEGSVANIFLVSGDLIRTNDEQSSILLGITRDSVLSLARDLGYTTEIGELELPDLRQCDEVFLTGTASEVVPVREVDLEAIGDGERGEVTARLQEAYFAAVTGRDARHRAWLDFVDQDLLVGSGA